MTTPTRGRRSHREPPAPDSPPAVEPAAGDDRRPALPPLPARRRLEKSRRSFWPVAAAMTTLAAMVLYGYGTARPRGSGEVPAMGIFLLPLLLGLATFIIRPATKNETRFDLRGIMLFGLALRGFGAYFRFAAPADALIYHREGQRLAPELQSLNFFFDTGRKIPGTGWIRYVSAWTHAFFVDDMFATFMFFTFLSFVGTYFLYRAFARAVPDGDHRRYALLLFLWPSLLFWPSSIGKEAWMIFGLGIAAWGVARVLTGTILGGLVTLTFGLVVLSLVRPHIALMVVIALGIALLARPVKSSSVRFFGRMISIVLLLIGGALIAGRTAEFLNVDNTGTEGLSAAFEDTVAQTAQGGAAFSPAVVRSPLDYPFAFTTVWFRPFPWEAIRGGESSTQLISAAENLMLLGLLALSWRRLISLPKLMFRSPYVTFALTYSFVFVYAFSVIGNFGILARQRTQGIVFLFVALCVPVVQGARAGRGTTSGMRGDGTRGVSLLRREPGSERPDVGDVADERSGESDRAPGRRRQVPAHAPGAPVPRTPGGSRGLTGPEGDPTAIP